MPAITRSSRIVLLFVLLLATIGQTGAQTAEHSDRTYANIATIEACLAAGFETVLTESAAECVPYARHNQRVPPDTPYRASAADACASSSDFRLLPGDVIKRLLQKKDRVQTSGIRIFGAIFCEEVDLVGIDIPFGITLDNSFFAKGINARNFRTRGDLSIDHSLVFRHIWLYRANIGGSFFARESFISKLDVLDADIRGAFYLSDSILDRVARFDSTKVGGEINLRRSALSFLLVQFSQVGGLLDLSQSEAQCGYHIRKNELGEALAANFGLGRATRGVSPETDGKTVYHWRRLLYQREIRQMLRRDDVSKSVTESSLCEHLTERQERVSKAEFVLFDNRIKSSLCLRNFTWLEGAGPTSGAPQRSNLTLNYTTVGSHLILNFAPRRPGEGSQAPPDTRFFEAVGLEARSLILNFSTDVAPSEMFLDAVRFDRVQAGNVDCPYQQPDLPTQWTNQPTSARELGAGFIRESTTSGPDSRRPPTDAEVREWLKLNQALTIQPFTAFIEAFDRAGQDATALRIARADRDLQIQKDAWMTTKESASYYERTTKHLYFVMRDIWRAIADHGYQPIKAWWAIAGLIALAGFYFWGLIGVVGFVSEKRSDVQPIGILFLFDRLIPLYNIRQEHYQIKAFYRRDGWSAIGSARRNGSELTIPSTKKMIYFGIATNVTEAAENQVKWAEICLDFLRAAGVLLAVFVVATINALVAR